MLPLFLYKKILFYPFPSPQIVKKWTLFIEKAFSSFFLAMVLAVTSAIVVARAYRAAKEDSVGALSKE